MRNNLFCHIKLNNRFTVYCYEIVPELFSLIPQVPKCSTYNLSNGITIYCDEMVHWSYIP